MIKNTRQTQQKKIITDKISKINGFFSAEEIFESVKKIDKNIGIATVYRFLKQERKQNRLYTYTCDRRILYSKENNNHCHYICEKTGKITHFKIDSLDFLKNIKSKIPGKITSVQLEIRGTCEECN